MFLYTLYSVSLCFVLFIKSFSFSFFFFMEEFLMPFVIQGLNFVCGLNLILIFGKRKEREISGNLLYGLFTFCKFLKLFQSILRNFCLNLLIDWFEILRSKMYCSGISVSLLFFVAKMIAKWSQTS